MIRVTHSQEQAEVAEYLHPSFISESPFYRCLILMTPKGKAECQKTSEKGLYRLNFKTAKKEHSAEVFFQLTDKEEIEFDIIEASGKQIKICIFLRGSFGGSLEWVASEATPKKKKTK